VRRRQEPDSLVLGTAVPVLVSMTALFAIYVLLRGHDEPGGGFIGALIGASAVAVYTIDGGVAEARRALYFAPTTLAGVGLLLSCSAGLLAGFAGLPPFTGLWPGSGPAGLGRIPSVLLFDVGVFLAVLGSAVAVIFALEEKR
jgi:multicomponent Na+:H+ antiporter subunit B